LIDITKYLQHTKPDLKKLDRLAWFDNSTIESFQNCNREAWYNAFHGFGVKSAPMAAGSVWHSGLEVFNKTKDLSQANLALAREYEKHKGVLLNGPTRLAFGAINATLAQYASKYANDQVVHHAQEVSFAIWMQGEHEPLGIKCPPGNCQEHPEFYDACFWYVGRFDGIVTYLGSLWLLEHKTTGQLGPSYQQGLQMSRQARAYMYGVKKILATNNYEGPPLKGVLFDVTKFAAQVEFNRFGVLIHDAYLREWEEETYDLVAQIRQSWTSTRKPTKNTKSCTKYGQCPYIDLCQAWAGKDKTDKPGLVGNFKIEPWTPF